MDENEEPSEKNTVFSQLSFFNNEFSAQNSLENTFLDNSKEMNWLIILNKLINLNLYIFKV